MNNFVNRPRYASPAALRAIVRAPIHASVGCSLKGLGQNFHIAVSSGSGNVIKSDVFFGIEDKLREQIQTTLEVME